MSKVNTLTMVFFVFTTLSPSPSILYPPSLLPALMYSSTLEALFFTSARHLHVSTINLLLLSPLSLPPQTLLCLSFSSSNSTTFLPHTLAFFLLLSKSLFNFPFQCLLFSLSKSLFVSLIEMLVYSHGYRRGPCRGRRSPYFNPLARFDLFYMD